MINVGLERHQPRVAIRLPEQVELHGVQFPRREGNPQNSLQACAVELLHQQVCTISFTGIWCFESYFVPLKRPFYRNPSILKRERENKSPQILSPAPTGKIILANLQRARGHLIKI